MQSLQANARSAAQALHTGNGLGTGALQPSNVAAWQNARAPVASVQAGGRIQVKVTQTAAKAVLAWSSFNVGASTDLTFDQSAGGSSANTWVALNRLNDPTAAPSLILGSIRAQGQVYVINRNGIIFGAQSQVNVGALLASTAEFAGGAPGFPANGIYSAAGTAGLLPAFGGSAATDAASASAILVQAGAQITTSAPATVLNGGGYVLLMAGSVQNAGAITTPQGQVALAAGQRFVLTPGYSNSGGGDPLATTLGSQIAVVNGGRVTNSGLIQAARGDITLAGHAITQAGVALSTTTTNQRGTIHLLTATTDTTGSVTFSPGSLTQIAPELDNTTTALNSQRTSLIAISAANDTARLTTTPTLNNVAGLADRLDQSRIEITTGGAVSFGAGSLTQAQAGQIAVSSGNGRIFAESSAQLDVSGVSLLPVSVASNILTVNIQPTELRDSPANRDSGLLAGKTVYVDARGLTTVAASIADTANRLYTPGGLLEVSGYANNVGHTIGEWSTLGGTVTLAGGQVVLQRNAAVNLAGGSLAYQGGLVNTSWLTGSDGHIYPVAQAPSSVSYTGVYGGFVVNDTKWNVSATYRSPLAAPAQVYQKGYTVGRDAGSLILSTPTALIDGTIDAGVVTGNLQTAARPAAVTDPFILAQTVAPVGGVLALGKYSAIGLSGTFATDVVLGGAAEAAAVSLTATDKLPSARNQTVWLSGELLNGSGLASLRIATAEMVTVSGALMFQPGGQVSLTAPNITVRADITAPGAAITLGNQFAPDGTFLTTTPASTSKQSAAVLLTADARINAAGMWNNRQLDPNNAAGAAFINGGSVTIDSSQALTLLAGSAIDVSSGGSLSWNPKVQSGKGGSITLIADDPRAGNAEAPLVLAGALRGYGMTGGGALSITAPRVEVATGGLAAPGMLLLTPEFFRSGFASYAINGLDGLEVAPGTRLDVVTPTYSLAKSAPGTPTGANPGDALNLGLTPLFLANPAKATFTQRAGASLVLQSSRGITGGAITVDAGADITVDPGQSVALQAYNSITVNGTIAAPAGSVSIVNTRYQDGTDDQRPSLYTPGLAVWLGASSRIDVSGLAVSSLDNHARRFGIVQDGGTISIGGVGGTAADGTLKTTDAQIIIRPGATLEANGASGLINPFAGQDTSRVAVAAVSQSDIANMAGNASNSGLGKTGLGNRGRNVLVAGNGGTIALSSYTGIFPNGTLQAMAGGAGAAGGSLSMTLETPIYNFSQFSPAASLLVPRELIVSQTATGLLPARLVAGAATPQLAFGRASIGADQITGGGFANVALSNRGLFLFDGNVSLSATQSISLANGILADSSSRGTIRIAAPYVTLGGDTSVTLGTSDTSPLLTQTWVPPTIIGSATLEIVADQIDVANDVRLGTGSMISDIYSHAGSTSYPGFATLSLRSRGDLRFLPAANSVSGRTTLFSDGTIRLDAAQIYPTTGAQATVVAGFQFNANVTKSTSAGTISSGTASPGAASPDPLPPGGKLIIGRTTQITPPVPDSIGGSLTLVAGQVVQGGVVRAPLGNISLGDVSTASGLVGFGSATAVATTHVLLMNGSLTSVSADGLTAPYGGTSDGVTYTYNGGTVGTFTPTITLAGRSIEAVTGSFLDLHGGGSLNGGGGELCSVSGCPTSASLVSQGFIPGRGGSTDPLTSPLLRFDPTTTKSPSATLATNPVYAIVPGYAGATAPAAPLDQSSSYYGSLPATGQSITVGAGVPGLAAGTYALLPSYYALLPGAFRVELAPGHAAPLGALAVGTGTWLTAVRTGVINTSVRSAVYRPAYVTPAASVLKYGSFTQQTYSDFQIAQAATYDRARPLLPRDAGTLMLSYPAEQIRAGALSFAGGADFGSGGGYGGTLVVSAALKSNIEITGPSGATPLQPDTKPLLTVALDAAALDAFGAPRMVIGGIVTYSPGTANVASQPAVLFKASAGSVTVDDGAILAAPEVFLIASNQVSTGAITINAGATIDTIGRGTAAYDSVTSGLPYDVQRNTALLASNGQITLAPTNLTQRGNSGPLTIADGSTIVSSGSIVGSTESSVLIGSGAIIGTANLALSVPVVAIGTPGAGVPVPNGLALSKTVLTRLLNGDTATGAPPLRTLEVTASGGVDFYGTVDFTAGGLREVQLNTPAIYGQGVAGDVARLEVGTLVWNGVVTTGTSASSVLPQGVVAGGAGTGHGTLDIETTRLVLGYTDGVAPTQSVTLDRVIAGFDQVILGASDRIVFNNAGTLSVYAQVPGVGQPGTGGSLTLASPLIIGASGASLAIAAGGQVTFATPVVSPVLMSQAGQGASLTVTAPSIEVGTTLALNAGRISLTATSGDVLVNSQGRLDASGPVVTLFDQGRGSPGGTVALESRTGAVAVAAGAVIDVSAAGADAGSLSVTAPAGPVTLSGSLLGAAPDGLAGGRFVLRAGQLADFSGLNATLDQGGFTEARAFDVFTGDLAVNGTIRAHNVSIAASGGSLSIGGTIDASGAAPGQIALAASGALTLGPHAVLDAHATQTQTDSAGASIASANRADISLRAGSGVLRLQGGATIDVSNASNTDLGTVELYAPRIGANDVAIDIAARPAILGAVSVAAYGSRTYSPANGILTQSELDAADKDSTAFIDAALANPALRARLAGLSNVHLRPEVVFQRSGDMTISGDGNLEGFRYASLSGGGMTEPGSLLLRAGGTLRVFGSISDGFGAPVDRAGTTNPDDNGWLLPSGVEPAGQSVVVPVAVTLAAGTVINAANPAPLSYDITLLANMLNAGVLIPGQTSLSAAGKIGAGGWVATSAIHNAMGQLLFAKGALIPGGTELKDVIVDPGAVLPLSVRIATGTVWPAGTSLAGFQHTSLTLSRSALVAAGGTIPSGTKIVLLGGAKSIQLRAPTAGSQGSILATAPLDRSGKSWNIAMVGGGDLASANPDAVQAASVLKANVLQANVLQAGGGGGDIVLSDLHYVNAGNTRALQPALSVVRTGTGDLSLLAGGDVRVGSLYGIYTAGTQTAGVAANDNLPRGTGFDTNGKVLLASARGFDYNSLLGGYQAWYPTGGGNVLVSAQSNLTGDVLAVRSNGSTTYQSDAVGNWLWRQGGSPGQPAAWWINFGSYVDTTDGSNTLQMVGFSGIGALGGGNVTVLAGGNAGNLAVNAANQNTTTALDVVVAGTGRSTESGITLTGGGNVAIRVGGTLNGANTNFSGSGLGSALFGVIGSLRGTVAVSAGAIGAVVPSANLQSVGPLVRSLSDAHGGPLLLLGDATAQLSTRGDLVLAGVIDPGRVPTANTTPWIGTIDGVATAESGGGRASFSLWQPTTAVSLASAGGTLVPTLDVTGASVGADMNTLYPPTLRAIAATGNIVYAGVQGGATSAGPAIELAPSPKGQLEFLAGGGINAAGLSTGLPQAIDISGAPNGAADLPSPTRPAFEGTYQPGPNAQLSINNVTNALDFAGPTSLFAFTADTPTSVIHAADHTPARFYAAGGDIVDLNFGETWRFVSGASTVATWYLAAKPALIQASRDIINAGSQSLLPVPAYSDRNGLTVTRNLILNDSNGDASVVSAGRDVFYANFDIAGPGNLEVSAGRNLYQADRGSLFSVGQIVGGSSSPTGGAGILLLAGLAQNIPDWSGFQSLYLGNVAEAASGTLTYTSPSVAGSGQTVLRYQPTGGTLVVQGQALTSSPGVISTTIKRNPVPASQASACVNGQILCDNHSIPGAAPLVTVARGYGDDLAAWMVANAGFVTPAGSALVTRAQALQAFQALPLYQRIPFLMQIYNSELAASGLEQTGALMASDSRATATSAGRLGSLVRGREAHAALEPDPATALPSDSTNAITLYGGSGVSTAFGGGITAFAPGGRLVLGLSSQAPPTPVSGQPAAGLITFGSGDVNISAYGSVLLGQSRIFTTFGGAIDIWSEGGDVNAGNGSKTTSVYQPPKIAYDTTGAITLSPSAPTSGAGIATLAPVAGVPAGDVVLVTEQGVIDTGEAGIRSSGRTSFTGTVVGSGGVTAAGGSFGLPSVSVPNVGALAAAASTSAAAAAGGTGNTGGRQASQSMPSIITVEVVSFGGDTFQ